MTDEQKVADVAGAVEAISLIEGRLVDLTSLMRLLGQVEVRSGEDDAMAAGAFRFLADALDRETDDLHVAIGKIR